jgi:hypothetical protein
MRSILEWSIRYHFFTALAAGFLLVESMLLNTGVINIKYVLFVFSLVLATYNAYRRFFQRVSLRKISFQLWSIRFRIRFLLILISLGYSIYFIIWNELDLTLVVALSIMFVFYSKSRFTGNSTVWLDVFGWIKAPILALAWFYLTYHFDGIIFLSTFSEKFACGLNRFGLLLLVALSNDVHDREKDLERGFKTWPARFSRMQIVYFGIFIASCMVATSIMYVRGFEWLMLTETGILNGFLGFSCLFLSYNKYQFYKHVLLMDGILIISSIVSLFANYLRNLPI